MGEEFSVNNITIYSGDGDNDISLGSNPFFTWSLPNNRLDKNSIEKIIFNPPATIVIYKDGSKTVVKTDGKDGYNPEVGFAMAMMKEMFNSRGEFKRFIENQKVSK